MAVPQLGPALDQLLGVLRTAGFQAAVDPSEVQLPGVWVQPRTLGGWSLNGGGTATVWLYVLASGSIDYRHAISQLDDGLEGLIDLLGVSDTDRDVELTAVEFPHTSGSAIPAYRLTVDIDI